MSSQDSTGRGRPVWVLTEGSWEGAPPNAAFDNLEAAEATLRSAPRMELYLHKVELRSDPLPVVQRWDVTASTASSDLEEFGDDVWADSPDAEPLATPRATFRGEIDGVRRVTVVGSDLEACRQLARDEIESAR